MPAHLELSQFQKEKLEFFFKFYDPSEDGRLDEGSLERFMKRVIAFTGWDENSAKAHECAEIHGEFFEILFEKAKEEGGQEVNHVNLSEWLDLWSGILPGCMGIQQFPIWLRLLPKKIFQMIDRNNDHEVGPSELVEFYRDMVRIPEDQAEARALFAYDQMTDEGRWPLNIDSYEMIFSNFMIGRTPFGPGRHIFGCWEHTEADDYKFQLISPAPEDSGADEDSTPKPYQQNKPKRTT